MAFEGFGSGATGGAGGQIIFVTNSNNSGAGSLRAAIDTPGPRIILFKVNSVLLTAPLLVGDDTGTYDDLSVYGQSAGGVEIRRAAGATFGANTDLVSLRASNIIWQGVAMRQGQNRGEVRSFRFGFFSGDTLAENPYKQRDVVVDHCSVQYGSDENLAYSRSIEGASVLHCMLTEPLLSSVSSTISLQWLISYGVPSASNRIPRQVTIARNFIGFCGARTPWVQGHQQLEWINNYVYNSEYRFYGPLLFGNDTQNNQPVDSQYHVLGNVYQAGPDSTGYTGKITLRNNAVTNSYCWAQDNLFFDVNGDPQPNALFVNDTGIGNWTTSTTTPGFTPSNMSILDESTVEDYCYANCGYRPADPDPVDLQAINKSIARQGGIPDDLEDTLGFVRSGNTFEAPIYSTGTGIPDGHLYLGLNLHDYQQWLLYNPHPVNGYAGGVMPDTPVAQFNYPRVPGRKHARRGRNWRML